MKNLRKLILGIFIGLFIGTLFILVTSIPKNLDVEWKKRGSPYDVEDEFRNTTIAFNLRKNLHKFGLDDDSHVGSILKTWQKKEMEKAFLKIPENDGERALWQHRYNIEGILNYRNRNLDKISEITPELLKTFDLITSMPIATRSESKQGKFLTANRIATFFFKNWKESGLLEKEKKYWLRHIVKRMVLLERQMDVYYLLSKKSSFIRLIPFIWIDTVIRGAGQVIDFGGDYNNCDLEMVKTIVEQQKKLRSILIDYQDYLPSDDIALEWKSIFEEQLKYDATQIMKDKCSNYKQ